MKAFSYQFRVELGDVDANLGKVIRALKECDPNSLVVLPEMFMCGFDYFNMSRHAEKTSKVLESISEISSKKNLTVIATYPTREDDCLFNTAMVVSGGKLLGKRHKIKLFPLYEETKHFCPGGENPVFETPQGRVGVLICFELRFCELSSSLREQGVEIVAVPSMWGAKRKGHLKVLSQARSIETQSYLVLSNACGITGEEEYAGSSAIFDPWGSPLAYAEASELLIEANIDLKEVEKVRRYIPMR